MTVVQWVMVGVTVVFGLVGGLVSGGVMAKNYIKSQHDDIQKETTDAMKQAELAQEAAERARDTAEKQELRLIGDDGDPRHEGALETLERMEKTVDEIKETVEGYEDRFDSLMHKLEELEERDRRRNGSGVDEDDEPTTTDGDNR
jgi:hypothetical protein